MAEEASAKRGSLEQGVGEEVPSVSPQESSNPQEPSDSQDPLNNPQEAQDPANSREAQDPANSQESVPESPNSQEASQGESPPETPQEMPSAQGEGKLEGNPGEIPNEAKGEPQGETEGETEETLDKIPMEADGKIPTETADETPEEAQAAEADPTDSLYGGKVTQADELSEPIKLPRLSPKQLAEIEIAGDIVVHSNRWKVGDLKRLRVGSLVEFDQKDLTKARLTLEGGLFCEGKLVSRSKHKVALHITKLYQKD